MNGYNFNEDFNFEDGAEITNETEYGDSPGKHFF